MEQLVILIVETILHLLLILLQLAMVLLLAMGYDVLSMNATSLPKVKKVLRNLRMSDAKEILKEVMEMDDVAVTRARLEKVLSDRGLQKFIPSRVD